LYHLSRGTENNVNICKKDDKEIEDGDLKTAEMNDVKLRNVLKI
jgi:hypothetical protein